MQHLDNKLIFIFLRVNKNDPFYCMLKPGQLLVSHEKMFNRK